MVSFNELYKDIKLDTQDAKNLRKIIENSIKDGNWAEMKHVIKSNTVWLGDDEKAAENAKLFKAILLKEIVQKPKYKNVYTYTDNIEILKLIISLEEDKEANVELMKKLNENINNLVNYDTSDPFMEIHSIDTINNLIYEDILDEDENTKLSDIALQKVSKFAYNHDMYLEHATYTKNERAMLVRTLDNKAKILERKYGIEKLKNETLDEIKERKEKLEKKYLDAKALIAKNLNSNEKPTEEELKQAQEVVAIMNQKEKAYLELKEAKAGLESNATLKNIFSDIIKIGQTIGLASFGIFHSGHNNVKIAAAEKAAVLTVIMTKLEDEKRVKEAFDDKQRQKEEREKAKNGIGPGWGRTFLNLCKNVVKFFDFTSFKPRVEKAKFDFKGKENDVRERILPTFNKKTFKDLCKDNRDIYVENKSKFKTLTERLDELKKKFGERFANKYSVKNFENRNDEINKNLEKIENNRFLTPTAEEELTPQFEKDFEEGRDMGRVASFYKEDVEDAVDYYEVLGSKIEEKDIFEKISFNTQGIDSNDLKDEVIFNGVFDKLTLLNEYSDYFVQNGGELLPKVEKDFSDTIKVLEEYTNENLKTMDEDRKTILNSNIKNFTNYCKDNKFGLMLKDFGSRIQDKSKQLGVNLGSKDDRIGEKLDKIYLKDNLQSLSNEVAIIKKDAGILRRAFGFLMPFLNNDDKIDDISILHSIVNKENVFEYNEEYLTSCFKNAVETFMKLKRENYSSYEISKNKMKEIIATIIDKRIVDPNVIKEENEKLISAEKSFDCFKNSIEDFFKNEAEIKLELIKYANSLENDKTMTEEKSKGVAGRYSLIKVFVGETEEKQKFNDLLEIQNTALNAINGVANENAFNNIINILEKNKDLILNDKDFSKAYDNLVNSSTILLMTRNKNARVINGFLKNKKVIELNNLIKNKKLAEERIDVQVELQNENTKNVELEKFKNSFYKEKMQNSIGL